MTPERIFAGAQAAEAHHGRTLSDIQKQRVAEFMGGRPMGSINAGEAKSMPNQCTANPPMRDPASGPAWNGWGNDLAQHALPAGGRGAAHGGRRAATEIEVGVRHSRRA